MAAGTQTGVILGTAGYMSPEQARGRPVDKRADIWAFGVVLLEMLTGQQCFAGETLSDTLASVLKTDPDLDALPEDTPFAIRKLIERCLTKDPKRRLRDIGDARIDVLDLITESGRVEAVAGATSPKRSQLIAAVLVTLVLGVLATSLVFWNLRPTPPARDSAERKPIRRYSINLSPDAPLQPMEADGSGTGMALSPDGLLLVYVADTGPNQHQLFLCRLDQLDDARPFDISPDGQRFLMIKEDKEAQEAAEAVETPPTTELIVVDNWDEVLKRITPAEGKP
jgi:serine/threonine-protein kinase